MRAIRSGIRRLAWLPELKRVTAEAGAVPRAAVSGRFDALLITRANVLTVANAARALISSPGAACPRV